MKYLKLSLIAVFIYTCFIYSCSFDRESWIKNNDVNQFGFERQLMINDLTNNILKNGMSKSEVIELLGKPHYDGVQIRPPEGKNIPDSIRIVNSFGESKAERRIALDRFNNWMKINGQPDTILLYPAGFSRMDQNFLTIKIDGNNLVKKFSVLQH